MIPITVLSLQELCCRSIVSQTSVYTIDRLPLPPTLHSQLRSYALSSGCARHHPHHPNHHHEMKMAIKKSRLSHVHAKLTCVISWFLCRFFIFLLSIAILKVLPALLFVDDFLCPNYVNPLSVLLNEFFLVSFSSSSEGKIQRSLEGETIFLITLVMGVIHAYLFNKQEDIWWKEFYRNS